jgi:hypothetical protein
MRVVAIVPPAVALAACLQSPPAGGEGGACFELDDRFDLERVDTDTWISNPAAGGSVEVAGGELVLQAAPDAGYTYVDVSTVQSGPVDGLSATADIAVTWNGMADVGFVLSRLEAYIGVYADSGLIGVARDVGNGFEWGCGEGQCQPYDAGLHRFWRLRAVDGLLHLETSADGTGFTELVEPQPVPAGDHLLVLWAEAGAGNQVVSRVRRVHTSCSP